MDTHQAILTKLDVRQFSEKKVPAEIKSKVLEAARAAQTGMNKQHWKLILVQDKTLIKKLANDSTKGHRTDVFCCKCLVCFPFYLFRFDIKPKLKNVSSKLN